MSVDGCPGAPEFAESMAGDPSWRRKLAEPGATHCGSACRPLPSCPVAAWSAESEVYWVLPHVTMVPEEVRYTRS